MSIHFQKSGVLSTIQDLGRNGFRRFGINPNGAMDKCAVRLINVLLGNAETEAVLEMHFPAPVLRFDEPAIIALGGADFEARLDDQAIENWRFYFAEKNQTLTYNRRISGNRAYLSIRGGFKIGKWLGSASTNLTAQIGGFENRALRKSDCLLFNSAAQISNSELARKISRNIIPHYSSFPTLRVTPGAEYGRLTASGKRDFLESAFTISHESDRMGFRLNGKPLETADTTELASSAVSFGTIQFLPDRQMIILMADAQTSGGYPRLAHVASVDLPLLAQLGATDKVGFQTISQPEAERLTLEFEKDLNLLKIGVNFRYAFKR